MPVTTFNTSVYTQHINGFMLQTGPAPKIITNISSALANPRGLSFPGLSKLVPEQVIGLVPLFNCCSGKDSIGSFLFGSFDSKFCLSGLTTLSIQIGPLNIGSFTYSSSSSNSDIQNDINALLSTYGFACIVSGVSTLRYCVINSPAGSGTEYNETNIFVYTNDSSCGNVIKTVKFRGGTNSDGFNCDPACDCREYGGDTVSDDRKFVLPVYASTDCSDSYKNDSNGWILKYPGTYDAISKGDFRLQKLINGVWATATVLDNTSYGTPYNNNFYPTNQQCENVNYCGYKLDWKKVLSNLGEGSYRFYVTGQFSGLSNSYCFYSPPFCLKTFDCTSANGTCKFEAEYSGGNFGSVTTQGDSWSLCCTKTVNNTQGTVITSAPIQWSDSIRFFGFFGREGYEPTRDYIKYSTGEIKKVRDEVVKVFDCETSQMPMWFHQRLASYGFMADRLFVSDYNLNNDSYQYKRFWVVSDSEYKPLHRGFTRYPKVRTLKFKEGLQYIYRDRCCGANKTINNPVPPPPESASHRIWSNGDTHLWANNVPSKF